MMEKNGSNACLFMIASFFVFVMCNDLENNTTLHLS